MLVEEEAVHLSLQMYGKLLRELNIFGGEFLAVRLVQELERTRYLVGYRALDRNAQDIARHKPGLFVGLLVGA